MRRIVTALSAVALAFSMVSLAGPANAAVSGYDSQYAGESAFLTLSPGGTGSFTVFFANTGTTSWVKGTASQVDLAACLEDKVTCNAQDTSESGFNDGTWLSSTRYASATQATVAPGQIGTFSYTVKVPATQAAGVNHFNGALVLSATGGDIHNEGYFQDVQVTVTTTIAITSCGTSPSSASTTTVTGTGAGAAATVAIKDGTTQVATATADSAGAFSASVTGLTEGAHSFIASTTQQTSAACSLTVDLTKPKLSSVSGASTSRLTMTFSENMTCASIGTATYTLKDIGGTAQGGTLTGAGVSASTTGTKDCLTGTLSTTTALTNGTQYTITVTGATDAAGNTIDTANNSATVVVSDTTGPSATTAAFTAQNKVKITFNEQVSLLSTANGARNPANYTYDSQSGTTAFTDCGTNATTFADNVTCTLAVNATTGSHTIVVSNIKDPAGNLSGTSTLTATFPPTTTRPTITSVTSPNLFQVVVTYDAKMGANASTCGVYNVTKSDGTAVTGFACNGVTADSAVKVMTISVTGLSTGTTYNLVTTGAVDVFGNVLNPSPTISAFTATADTTKPTVVSTSTPSSTTCDVASTAPCNQTQFTVTYSESMNTTVGGANSIINAANYALPTTAKSSPTAATVTVAGCQPTDSAGTASTKAATCFLNGAIQPGSYTLTISGTGSAGNVLDLSGNPIDPLPSTITVTFTDTSKPTAASLGTASQGATANIQVNFSEVMDSAGGSGGATSALNPANYKIDNVALTTSNTTIACGTYSATNTGGTALAPTFVAGACNNVVLTISSSTVILRSGNPHTITIGGLKDLGANALNPDPTTLAFSST